MGRTRKRKIVTSENEKKNQPAKKNKLENVPKIIKDANIPGNPIESSNSNINIEGSTQDTSSNPLKDGDRLHRDFFEKSCEDLSKALLGTTLVRKLDTGEVLKGMIVETEAYLGQHDKSAHSYELKVTNKNKAMFMDPGTIYVYHIYGVYTCINFSSQGKGCAVLVRAVDPIEGIETMKLQRGMKRADKGKGLKDKDLGSGPSKLTQAFSVDKLSFNQKDSTTDPCLWLEKGVDIKHTEVVIGKRIGIESAGPEWANKPLRYYVLGNKSVSVKDKNAEVALLEK